MDIRNIIEYVMEMILYGIYGINRYLINSMNIGLDLILNIFPYQSNETDWFFKFKLIRMIVLNS